MATTPKQPDPTPVPNPAHIPPKATGPDPRHTTGPDPDPVGPRRESAATREGETGYPPGVPIDPATGQPSYNPYTLTSGQTTGLPQSGDPTQPLNPAIEPTSTRSDLEPEPEAAMKKALAEGEEEREEERQRKDKTGKPDENKSSEKKPAK